MATWNIGIDESGDFRDCFEPKHGEPSFVCAVVTRKKEDECKEFFKRCAVAIDSDKFQKSYNSDEDVFFSNIICNFFHAWDVKKKSGQEFLDSSMNFIQDCGKREEFFEKIFVSSENTEFVGSRQNYYLNSLYEVLGHIFESGLFQKRDSINVFIARRTLEVIGLELSADVVTRQLYAKLNTDAPDRQDIEKAIEIVNKYGGKQDWRAREKDYSGLMDDYHNKLSKSIRKFLKKSYPYVEISGVQCRSAKKYVFPAMADIAATLVNRKVVVPEKAKKRRLIKGYNVQAFIEAEEFDTAAQLIGGLFFDTSENPRTHLDGLFESVTKQSYDSVWKILTELCIEKMHNRGTEGDQFSKTGDLIKLLDEFIERHKPSPIVYARYLKMKGEFAQHSGSVDLGAARNLAGKIKDLRKNCRDKEIYTELYDIEEEFWIESYAQVMFNSYDFNEADYKRILEKYESNIKSLPYYSEIYAKDDFKDKRYSVILGTLGQALAFSGNHKKAIEYLLEDHKHSNYMKNLPASFLVVEYLRKGELENAVAWFKTQVKEVLGEEKTMEQFFLEVEDGKKVDNWLVLNFLRLWAYSMKIGKPAVNEAVSFEKWTVRDYDPYPGGLVLKWTAICNFYAKGSKEITIALLNKSIEVMTKDSTFTINSLALSPMRVLNVLDAMPIEKYTETYNDLCIRCGSFANYAKANPVLDPQNECKDVWDAAMILPFHYA